MVSLHGILFESVVCLYNGVKEEYKVPLNGNQLKKVLSYIPPLLIWSVNVLNGSSEFVHFKITVLFITMQIRLQGFQSMSELFPPIDVSV